MNNKITYQLLRFKTNSKKVIKDITPPVIWNIFNKREKNPLARGAGQRENYLNPIKSENMHPERMIYLRGHPVMEIKSEKMRYLTGISYFHKEHHMSRFYNEGQSALEDFYAKHHPVDMFGHYFINTTDKPSLPINKLPWSKDYDERNENFIQGEVGLGAESHGVQHYGPVSKLKIKLEAERLTRVYESIKTNGFVPYYGFPIGYFLQNNKGDWVFVVLAGQHRTAAMIKLGFKSIPVQFMLNYSRIIYEKNVHDWPMVANGEITEELALQLFHAFFDANRKLDFVAPKL